MYIVSEIRKELTRIGQKLSSESLEFDVSVASNLKQGDIATNIALIHYKKLGFASPQEAAEKIASEFNSTKNPSIEKIHVAGAGFINFYLSKEYLSNSLQEIVQKEQDMSWVTKKPQKIIVEFGDPNPFKEIHIGHLRNFCIGDSLSKLLETQGNEVIRANYQGDVGMHVAKAVWALKKKFDTGQLTIDKIDSKVLSAAYVEGAKEFDKDEGVKSIISGLNKKIYEEETETKSLWEEGRKVSLEQFEEFYRRIGLHYDKYYFESVTAKKGKDIVLSHIDDGVFERDSGAVIYRGEKEGLHTRVFLTSQGYATYEGKDLALAILKNEDEKYDESIILTGNEQLEYFQVMLAALKKIKPELYAKTKHFTFGHVRLREGKMSSRTGDVITASWLLDEAVSRVQKEFAEMDNKTAEKVGVGAVKYSMLKFSMSSDIHFSFEESISIEGNSGPYLQYTYVRAKSVQKKSEAEGNNHSKQGEQSSPFTFVQGDSMNLEPEESGLLRLLIQYPYHLEEAVREFAPNLLCNYLFELSQKFNLFYQKHSILNPTLPAGSDPASDVRQFRLQLAKVTGNILKNGLFILGIEAVEKM